MNVVLLWYNVLMLSIVMVYRINAIFYRSYKKKVATWQRWQHLKNEVFDEKRGLPSLYTRLGEAKR